MADKVKSDLSLEQVNELAMPRIAGQLQLPKAKVGHVRLAEYGICPFNLRSKGGEENVGGVALKDTYDLATLADEVISAGKILERTMVCLYEGIPIVIRGNRRAEVVRMILGMSNADLVTKVQLLRPDVKDVDAYILELYDCLNKVDAIIYGELSKTQVIFLLNDQTSKEYNSYELVKGIHEMFSAGIPYKDVLAQTWQNLWVISGKNDSYMQIANAKTTAERADKITRYGEGALRQAVWNAFKIGHRPLKNFLMHHAYINNMVPGFEFKPRTLGPCEFFFKRDRYVLLNKLYNEDAKAGLIQAGISPKVEAEIEKFIKEDSSPKEEKNPDFKPLNREKAEAMHAVCTELGLQPIVRAFAGFNPDGKTSASQNEIKATDTLLWRVRSLQNRGWATDLATMSDEEFSDFADKLVG